MTGKKVAAQEAAADQLMELVRARGMNLFHAPDGRPFAVASREGRREVYGIYGETFGHVLSREYYADKGKTVPKAALETAVRHLAAAAKLDGPMLEVHNRVAPHPEGGVVIDLGDATWRAIRVHPGGWEVTGDAALFVRDKAQQPLPEPVAGGDVEELREYVPLRDDDWRLLVPWIVQAWMPRGPYPLLELTGLAGSAKTGRTRIIVSLIDPHLGNLQSMPREERDLQISALHTHVLAFDNISRIPAGMSDTLCRLATGGGFRIRRLYSDAEETIIDTCRPVIVNGINRVLSQQDLISRAVQITVPPMRAGDREFEAEIFPRFEMARPRILGAFLTLMSRALAELSRVTLTSKPRMADFARLGVAVERVLGWPEGAFLSAYDGANCAALESSLEEDAVGGAIVHLLQERGSWVGTASDLHVTLEGRISSSVKRSKGWPKSSHWLSNRLDRLATGLAAVGIGFEKLDSLNGVRKVICLSRDRAEQEASLIASRLEGAIASAGNPGETSGSTAQVAMYAKNGTSLTGEKEGIGKYRITS